jgi:hypothetical protein
MPNPNQSTNKVSGNTNSEVKSELDKLEQIIAKALTKLTSIKQGKMVIPAGNPEGSEFRAAYALAQCFKKRSPEAQILPHLMEGDAKEILSKAIISEDAQAQLKHNNPRLLMIQLVSAAQEISRARAARQTRLQLNTPDGQPSRTELKKVRMPSGLRKPIPDTRS